MEQLAIDGPDDECKNGHFWKMMIPHQNQVLNFQETGKHLENNVFFCCVDCFLPDLVFKFED